MALEDHADAGFHNESKSHSLAGSHIFLSENDPEPMWNGPVLKIVKMIKCFMSSVEEDELGALLSPLKK